MKTVCLVLVFVLLALQCLASDDSPFQLINKATGFCLVKTGVTCDDIRWTTGGRLLVEGKNRCLGVQGKSVGSEVHLYDCDENSELQKWECKNETVLALQGQELYVEPKADGPAVLSKTIGPNSHLTISGTSSGACSRTYREIYTIEGTAAGRMCMFPFMYDNQWYSSCTLIDSEERLWCSVETKYEHENWGYCPTNIKENWHKHPSGAVYQLNTQSALTWLQAETSCKQQGASLLSITDPHQQAYVTALLDLSGIHQGYKLWTGLTLDSEHGWKWTNGNAFRYLNWDSGYPISYPGHVCGIMDGSVRFSWQNSKCDKKLGYICYSKGVLPSPTESVDAGFCSAPWIPYNGHCFHLYRTEKTWTGARSACLKEGGDLTSIRNVEDQSFVISQLGYASTDELWIGLNDKKTEGLFDWSDQSTVSFISWELGKPAVTAGQEDCVLIRGESGNWADRECQEKHGFICMKTSSPEPSGDEVEQNPGCRIGWKRHGSYCYFIGTETKMFDEAKDHCRGSDSYLADISSRMDNAFLVSLVGLRPEKHFWLGLSNQMNKDVFEWTNTKSVRFTHWNFEMPGHSQGCVAMATGSFAGLWDVLPCTNREKFICKHLAEWAILTPAPPTVPSTTCELGWTKFKSRNLCYKMYQAYSKQKTWYEARDFCRAIGGDLVSFHSAAELKMEPWSSGKYWIGLHVPDRGAGFVWSDGSPVNFKHWHDGEPNNKNNVEDCVEFFALDWHKDGSWNDNHCEKQNSWICQISTGVSLKPSPPPATPDYNITSDGWLEWKGNQYFMNKQKMAMEDARQFCKQRHADLVIIDSEAEWSFLWKQVYRIHRVWIGMTVDLDKTFQWVDGSPVLFQMWEEGQPDFKNFDENCVSMMSHTGLWHDNNCGTEFSSICKRSHSPPVNTTVAPMPVKGGCKDTWKKLNFKCYKIISDQNFTWHEARQQCRDMGGNLASISSRHVQVFLMSQMVDAPTTDLWIGFHNLYTLGFYWTDGQPKSYTNLKLPAIRDHPLFSYGYVDQNQMAFSRWYGAKCTVINTDSSLGIGKWIPKSCNDTNGFICLQNVDSSIHDSPEPTSTNYIKILNDSIKLVPQQMSWDAAKKHCEDDGASLASIRSQWTQDYIELLAMNLKRPVWIGLNKAQTNGYFKFVSGWMLTFTNWGINEPRTSGTCGFVDVDGKWKTSDCNQTISSVCMKSKDVPPTYESADFPGVCPEDSDEIYTRHRLSWKPFRGYCYLFISETKMWSEASVSCVEHGGTLASIENPFEQSFIQSNIQLFQDIYSSYWIGLFRTKYGKWMWLDKAVMDFTNWLVDETDSFHLSLGGLFGIISTSDGTWAQNGGLFDRPYICKTAKVLPAKPLPSASPNVGSTPDRGRTALVVVLVIAGLAAGTVIAIFFLKKSGRCSPIYNRLTNFDNPLFFGHNQSQPGLVDHNTLVENADEDNTQPVITI